METFQGAKEWLAKGRIIYDWLEDDESKEIFLGRLAYNISRNSEYLDHIIRSFVPGFENLGIYQKENLHAFAREIRHKAGKQKIILYGAGANAEVLFKELDADTVIGFCDRKAENGTYSFMGLPVMTVQELISLDRDVKIVIATCTYQNEILKTLRKYGIKMEDIIYNDKTSCLVYVSPRLYFDESLIQLCENEVFVDGGAYQGETTKSFIKHCKGNYRKIYVFEPDVCNFEICKKELLSKEFQNVQIFNTGLWDKEENLYFQNEQGAQCCINKDGNETIAGVALDEMILEDAPTFIKLDIEGAELNALKGMRGILKKQKPKLAICAYHKPEDLLALPDFIKQINPEYKLYLRHYSNQKDDLVLYAL